MRLTKQFARIAAVGAAACVLNVCMPMQAFGLQTSGVIRVTGFESAKAVDSDSYDAMRQIVTAAWDSMEESADLTKLKIRRDDFKLKYPGLLFAQRVHRICARQLFQQRLCGSW